MDSHDKEFEKFLQQFELRQPRAPFSNAVPKTSPGPRHRWWMVAATVAVVMVALIGLRSRIVPAESGAIVEYAGDSSFKSGESVTLGDVVHSGPGQALTLTLKDGSSVEMHPQSSLSIHTADDGQHVRLETGSIVVVAATQKTGRLSVRTRDAEVSGLGTIFMVETEAAGTRVGVIDGEVEVRSGATMRKLLDGEQFSTSPAATRRPLTEAIAWSRRAAEFTALLPVQPIVAFTPDPIKRLVQKETIPPPAPTRPAHVPTSPQEPPAPAPAPTREEPAQQPDSGAESSGVQILNRACGSCHVPDVVKNAHLDNRDAYASLVSRQISMGASLTQAEFNILVDYLFRTYGVRRAR